MKKDVNKAAGAGIDYFDPDLHIGVTCNGRNDADIDLVKKVEYWPQFQGFPRNFYPFLNQVRENTRRCLRDTGKIILIA